MMSDFNKKLWPPAVIGFANVLLGIVFGVLTLTNSYTESYVLVSTLIFQLILYSFLLIVIKKRVVFGEFISVIISLVVFIGLGFLNVYNVLDDYTYNSREHTGFISLNFDSLGLIIYAGFSFCALFVSCIIAKIYANRYKQY